MTTKKVFISLGSNIGDRARRIENAIDMILLLKDTKLMSTSSLMETSPVGVDGQDEYLNQIITIGTLIQPLELLKEFMNIERKLGRKPRPRWAQREIDIDIIIYEGVKLNTASLVIPHKELINRLFVLKGCMELDPDYVVEGLGKTVKELYFNNIDRLSSQKMRFALTS